MDRRNFFKLSGKVAGVAVAVPAALAIETQKGRWYDSYEITEIIPDGDVVAAIEAKSEAVAKDIMTHRNIIPSY